MKIIIAAILFIHLSFSGKNSDNISFQIEVVRGDYIEVYCATDAYCHDGTCYWWLNELKQTGIDNIIVFNLPENNDCMDGIFDLKNFYDERRFARYHHSPMGGI